MALVAVVVVVLLVVVKPGSSNSTATPIVAEVATATITAEPATTSVPIVVPTAQTTTAALSTTSVATQPATTLVASVATTALDTTVAAQPSVATTSKAATTRVATAKVTTTNVATTSKAATTTVGSNTTAAAQTGLAFLQSYADAKKLTVDPTIKDIFAQSIASSASLDASNLNIEFYSTLDDQTKIFKSFQDTAKSKNLVTQVQNDNDTQSLIIADAISKDFGAVVVIPADQADLLIGGDASGGTIFVVVTGKLNS